MIRSGLSSRLLVIGVMCSLAVAALLRAQEQQNANAAQAGAARRSEAKSTFETICASCHGLDGRGGERGPDVVSRPEAVRKSDADLLSVLRKGKTATGMPSFASYGPDRLSALVAYLRTLQGRGKEAALPGDPARGKVLFFGKAKCSECHMAGGRGGFFAQDLTTYAGRMTADEVRSAIVKPNKDLDPRHGLLTVTLADSTTLTGMARNEDNFSLQLQTADGVFHLLNKSDIRTLNYTGRSAMPADYGTVLTPAELNDLVSFLLRASSHQDAQKTKAQFEDDDEQE